FSASVSPLFFHSFPTRRSSDLLWLVPRQQALWNRQDWKAVFVSGSTAMGRAQAPFRPAQKLRCSLVLTGIPFSLFFPSFDFKLRDRKSTRLNSSHLVISYAVFC